MMIRKAENQYIYNKLGGYRAFIAREAQARWGATPNWVVSQDAPPLMAFIVRSDWVWRCECNEQIAAQPGEPAFCPNCLNAAFGGFARKVIFPGAKTAQRIEAILLQRIYPENRNWLPGETILMLERENREHPNGIVGSFTVTKR